MKVRESRRRWPPKSSSLRAQADADSCWFAMRITHNLLCTFEVHAGRWRRCGCPVHLQPRRPPLWDSRARASQFGTGGWPACVAWPAARWSLVSTVLALEAGDARGWAAACVTAFPRRGTQAARGRRRASAARACACWASGGRLGARHALCLLSTTLWMGRGCC